MQYHIERDIAMIVMTREDEQAAREERRGKRPWRRCSMGFVYQERRNGYAVRDRETKITAIAETMSQAIGELRNELRKRQEQQFSWKR